MNVKVIVNEEEPEPEEGESNQEPNDDNSISSEVSDLTTPEYVYYAEPGAEPFEPEGDEEEQVSVEETQQSLEEQLEELESISNTTLNEDGSEMTAEEK